MLVGLLGTVPLLLLGVVSLKLNVFEPRYVLAAAPAYVLILCVLVSELRFRVMRITAFSVVVLISLASISNYYFANDYAKSLDWRALASYLQQHVAPSDWITQAAADESFTFYCMEYQVPANCDDKLPANPNQSQQEIERLLTMRSDQHAAIWYVANPPSWANAQDAENWLQANLQQVRDTSADGLRIQEFMRWQVAPDEISGTPLATFGDSAALVGAQAWIEPTDSITVWLYWRALSQTETPLKVFLHLGSGDQIASQDDHDPQDGQISTDLWDVGMVYRDIYALPLTDVPTGNYRLSVGFYDPETNRRLPVGDGDSFTIETIQVP